MREGLIPHKVTTVMRLSTTQAAARALTEALGETLDADNCAVAAFEQRRGEWLVEVYFADMPNEAAVLSLVELSSGKEVAKSVRFATLDAKDWVAASLEGLEPVRAGRFLVHGAHRRAALLPNDIGIEIEASLAFGTGHHGTTRGCLLALDHLLRQSRPRRVLDVGTGTGVLAIAAAKALRGPIIAGDIDPAAIGVASANARVNGVASLIRFYVAPGLRHRLVARGQFDLILANILARPLARMAPTLAAALEPHGRLILSGLLEADAPGILAAFRAHGIRLASRLAIEGWVTLILG
jgi:ribosomal protein L11 methyltransferase